MNLLPKASGSRPRLACEIAEMGVVAGRSPEPGAPLAAVSRAELAAAAVVPSLRPGNIADRVAVITAVRRAMEQIGAKANARNAELTLVVPDAAVRVLLLDFDSLPNKLSDALPIVRFRLKKLVPFEPDEAMVSFQIMSSSRTVVRVLAVAIPRDVLSEYESVAREAGFEPGAVLPSTLAALAGLREGEGASLVVNAHTNGVTTAIVRAGIVLLHRGVELAQQAAALPANLPPALFEPSLTAHGGNGHRLPLVDPDETAGEWAAQQPLPEHGRNPYADQISAEAAVENEDGLTGMPVPAAFTVGAAAGGAGSRYAQGTNGARSRATTYDPAPVSRSPYASPTLSADLSSELHNAVLVAPTSLGTLTDPEVADDLQQLVAMAQDDGPEPPVHTLAPDLPAQEIARAVSVAVAWFEDSLGAVPEVLLCAGPLGAEGLDRMLREQGVAQAEGLRVRELVEAAALAPGAVTQAVARGSLAGVVGALRS